MSAETHADDQMPSIIITDENIAPSATVSDSADALGLMFPLDALALPDIVL